MSISAANLPQLSQRNTFQCVFGALGTITVSQVSSGSLSGPVQGPVTLTCPIPTGLSPFTQSGSFISLFCLKVSYVSVYSISLSIVYSFIC